MSTMVIGSDGKKVREAFRQTGHEEARHIPDINWWPVHS